MQRSLIFFCFVLLNAAAISSYAVAQNAEIQFWTAEDLIEVEDGQFRCPETLPSLEEKTREMERFLTWTQTRHPNWTVEQIVAFRMAVLEHHECTRTPDNIRDAPN